MSCVPSSSDPDHVCGHLSRVMQVLHVVPELRQHLERVCRAHFMEVIRRYPDDAAEWYATRD